MCIFNRSIIFNNVHVNHNDSYSRLIIKYLMYDTHTDGREFG